MQALRHLDVCYCRSTTSILWNVLPPNLAVLHAENRGILRAIDAPLGGDIRLRELRVRGRVIAGIPTNWAALVLLLQEIRVLSLAKASFAMNDGIDDALRSMPHLEKLDLGFCTSIGGPTFDVIATLSLLTELLLVRTAFFLADAARTLPRMHALQLLNVSRCDAVGAGYWIRCHRL